MEVGINSVPKITIMFDEAVRLNFSDYLIHLFSAFKWVFIKVYKHEQMNRYTLTQLMEGVQTQIQYRLVPGSVIEIITVVIINQSDTLISI